MAESGLTEDLALNSLTISPSTNNASVAALDVKGPVTMTKSLAVTGASTLTGNVTMAGNLAVTGATTLSSTLQGHKRPVEVVVDLGGAGGTVVATCTVAKSGTMYVVPVLSGGLHSITLPDCADAVGCTYTFVLTGATAGQDFDVLGASSEKILGAVSKGDGDNLAVSSANDSVGFDANAVIGSRFSLTCISATAAVAWIVHDILDGLALNTGGINLK
jgi:hypothetical protein